MHPMISVLKANNEKEPFSEEKVIASMRRAGVDPSIQPEVLSHIKKKLHNGITTNEIYHIIVSFLDDAGQSYTRGRYSLKEAIMMLGPTGYPFEDFVARLFEIQGFAVLVRQTLTGKCVTHEIDVILEKEHKKEMIETKFHNSHGIKSDIQVALYTKARFDDIKDKNGLTSAWIVTNTKTSIDANTYAQCVGMKIMSWDYPAENSLRDLIERLRLYPITMLTTLTQHHKEQLLDNHIVLCRDIKKNPQLLEILSLTIEERKQVTQELAFLTPIKD